MMTGAEFMDEVAAYSAEHHDAFAGLQDLIDEAVEEGRLIVPTTPAALPILDAGADR